MEKNNFNLKFLRGARGKLFLKSASSLLTLLASTAHGQFRFFYGENPRPLEVHAFEKTLLAFPSPPYTQICQPSGVVALDTVASSMEAQEILPRTEQLPNEELASLLKLTPLRQTGEALCAIKLINGETVLVNFNLSSTVQRPVVDFQNIKTSTGPAQHALKLGGLNIFRELLAGGELTYLVTITPNDNTHSTDQARYTLSYLGTDNTNFKAWRFKGKARKSFTAPVFLDATVGQLQFSAWQVFSGKNSREFVEGQEFQFYILTSNDVSVTEVFAKLP